MCIRDRSVEGADEETAAVFRSALANAVSVLNDDQATEEEVASAGDELQAAMSRVLASAGGSKMCIRDSACTGNPLGRDPGGTAGEACLGSVGGSAGRQRYIDVYKRQAW